MTSALQSDPPVPSPTGARTTIFKSLADGSEFAVGYVGPDGGIYRLRWDEGRLVGRIDERRVYRRTTHDEREVGYFTAAGQIHSHGLFTGGALGWVDEDGVVVQAGLILGEEEAGRSEGPELYAAGAALLLIFLPDDREENRRQ
jgi:hypothetical protein